MSLEFAIRRLIEAGIIEQRNNTDWIRAALRDGGRDDIEGTVATVDGDTITDGEQAWPPGMWGSPVLDGVARRVSRLRITEGAAAGQEVDILDTDGDTLQVAGGVDLVALGVAAGDAYEIDPPDLQEAIAWVAKTAIRCVLEFPTDAKLLPCYAVLQTNETEEAGPVGRLRKVETVDVNAGPVRNLLVSRWGETFAILCAGRTPEEAIWLARLMAHLYRSTVRYFDTVFRHRGVQLRGSGLRPVSVGGVDSFASEFTLTGGREKFAQEEIAWHVDSETPQVTVTPRRVNG